MTVVIAAGMAIVVVFICGGLAVTQRDDPVMSEKGFAILCMVAASFVVPAIFMIGDGHGRPAVQVEVDRGAGTLVLRQLRWPLPSRVRTFPLVRVMNAVVDVDIDGEDTRYMVLLLIEGEESVPLVAGMWGPGDERHEATAAAIRALLPPRAPSS
jgi:hypothetical protein